jgi:hypothetical protein
MMRWIVEVKTSISDLGLEQPRAFGSDVAGFDQDQGQQFPVQHKPLPG